MDMSASIAPKSDQLDAIELVAGPQTFTIEKVTPNNAEQPWNFHLAEFPRPWRPAKSMLRVMAAAWGLDGNKYAGHRVTLFCDPSVQFGNEVVGGVRISHMTGIEKPLKVPLLVKRGKSALFTVQPLKDAPKPPQQPAQGAVSDKVKADTAKAIQDGTVDAYLSFLADNNAPQHVINYVTQTAKETNPA